MKVSSTLFLNYRILQGLGKEHPSGHSDSIIADWLVSCSSACKGSERERSKVQFA